MARGRKKAKKYPQKEKASCEFFVGNFLHFFSLLSTLTQKLNIEQQ
jgi:hypothetical protein